MCVAADCCLYQETEQHLEELRQQLREVEKSIAKQTATLEVCQQFAYRAALVLLALASVPCFVNDPQPPPSFASVAARTMFGHCGSKRVGRRASCKHWSLGTSLGTSAALPRGYLRRVSLTSHARVPRTPTFPSARESITDPLYCSVHSGAGDGRETAFKVVTAAVTSVYETCGFDPSSNPGTLTMMAAIEVTLWGAPPPPPGGGGGPAPPPRRRPRAPGGVCVVGM